MRQPSQPQSPLTGGRRLSHLGLQPDLLQLASLVEALGAVLHQEQANAVGRTLVLGVRHGHHHHHHIGHPAVRDEHLQAEAWNPTEKTGGAKEAQLLLLFQSPVHACQAPLVQPIRWRIDNYITANRKTCDKIVGSDKRQLQCLERKRYLLLLTFLDKKTSLYDTKQTFGLFLCAHIYILPPPRPPKIQI